MRLGESTSALGNEDEVETPPQAHLPLANRKPAALSLGMAKGRGLFWGMVSGVARWGWAVAGKQELQRATGRVQQKGKPRGG